MYTLKIIPRTLHFKQPAGTSRGVYHTRQVWYLLLTDTETGQYGVGECAPLPALSCDDLPDYPRLLAEICEKTAANGYIDYEGLRLTPLYYSDWKPHLPICRPTVCNFGIPLSVAVNKVFLSTDSSGWVISMKCTAA